MNFNENDLWRNKTKLLNLRFSKLHSIKVLFNLEFDTKDQVLSKFSNTQNRKIKFLGNSTLMDTFIASFGFLDIFSNYQLVNE